MKFYLIMMMFSTVCSLMAFPSGKIIQETIETASKISGKVLSSAGKRAAAKSLAKAVAQYGDEVLEITRKGGLEVLKQSTKYGDDFWKIAQHAEPAAIRSLALHADELLPLAKRIGQDFLTLEAKVPGLAGQAVSLFGDDAVKSLAHAPADDIAKLIGIANKMDSSAKRKLLFNKYVSVPDKNKFLKALSWEKILAAGGATSAIILAYKAGEGIEDGLKESAQKSPETFSNFLSKLIFPFKWLIFSLVFLALWPFSKFLWQRSNIKFSPRQAKTETRPKD